MKMYVVQCIHGSALPLRVCSTIELNVNFNVYAKAPLQNMSSKSKQKLLKHRQKFYVLTLQTLLTVFYNLVLVSFFD